MATKRAARLDALYREAAASWTPGSVCMAFRSSQATTVERVEGTTIYLTNGESGHVSCMRHIRETRTVAGITRHQAITALLNERDRLVETKTRLQGLEARLESWHLTESINRVRIAILDLDTLLRRLMDREDTLYEAVADGVRP